MPGSILLSKYALHAFAAAAAGAALAAVAALALTASASGAAVAATAPACQTAGLVVWLQTIGNGAAGSQTYPLEFTNLSGHTCTLRGYPGVSAINLHGGKLGSAATRDSGNKTRTIRLGPGQTARTLVRITDAANFPPSRCHLVTAAGLRVFPPNQTASKTIPFPFQACARTGPQYLGVLAVKG